MHSTIQTAQNVSIHQRVAPVTDRIFAYLLDYLIIIGIYLLILAFWFGVDLGNTESFAFIMLMTLPIFLYDLLWETFNNGQTPGKMLLKVRVVNVDGSKVSFSSLLIRWLLRPIDISMTSGGIAIIFILLTGRGQRLGDIAAKTKLISERPQVTVKQLQQVQVPDDYVPVFTQVTVFNDEDMQKVNRIYKNAVSNRDHKLVLKLAAKLSEQMKVPFGETKPIDYVKQVIQDYHYYALKA